jgi:hypothetical protein
MWKWCMFEYQGTVLLSSISFLFPIYNRNFGKPIFLLATYFHTGFLLDLSFYLENACNVVLRNVG